MLDSRRAAYGCRRSRAISPGPRDVWASVGIIKRLTQPKYLNIYRGLGWLPPLWRCRCLLLSVIMALLRTEGNIMKGARLNDLTAVKSLKIDMLCDQATDEIADLWEAKCKTLYPSSPLNPLPWRPPYGLYVQQHKKHAPRVPTPSTQLTTHNPHRNVPRKKEPPELPGLFIMRMDRHYRQLFIRVMVSRLNCLCGHLPSCQGIGVKGILRGRACALNMPIHCPSRSFRWASVAAFAALLFMQADSLPRMPC